MNALSGPDSLRWYLTGAIAGDGAAQANHAQSLGRYRSSSLLDPLGWVVLDGGLAGLSIDYFAPGCGEGEAWLLADGSDAVRLRAPGLRAGPRTELAVGASTVVPSSNADLFAVVTRDGSGRALVGFSRIALGFAVHNAVSLGRLEIASPYAGVTRHRCLCFKNVGSGGLGDVRCWLRPIGDVLTVVTYSTAAGVATVRVSGDLQGWAGGAPLDHGGCAVFNRTKGEVAFCRSMDGSAGLLELYDAERDLYNETGGGAGVGVAWAAGDLVYCIMPVRFGYEAPSAQPSGQFTMIGTETSVPGGVSFVHPVLATDADALLVGSLAAGNIGGLWLEQTWPAAVEARARNLVDLGFSFLE